METKGFFQLEIIISGLFSSFDLFEYICYGSTPYGHYKYLTILVQGSILDVRICLMKDASDYDSESIISYRY